MTSNICDICQYPIMSKKDDLIFAILPAAAQYSNIHKCLAKIGDHVNGVCGPSQILTQTWSRQVCQYIPPLLK